MNERNWTEELKRKDEWRAGLKPAPGSGLTVSELIDLTYMDAFPSAKEFLVKLIVMSNDGYFFKFGTSLKANGFLLQVSKAGMGTKYLAFRNTEEFENLISKMDI